MYTPQNNNDQFPCLIELPPKLTKPEGPPNRIINELGDFGRCEKCGSSILGSFLYIFGDRKCINPNCKHRVSNNVGSR